MALTAVVGLGMAACGSSGASNPPASEDSHAASVPGITNPTGVQAGPTGAGATPGKGCDIQVSEDLAAKPTIQVPDCAVKPTMLVARDIVAGSGPAAQAGASVTVKYVGVSWSTRQQFDASWDNGLGQFTVAPLGHAQVITGWNQGLIGVKKGARRLLVIPPDLGYGAAANGPIAANETLIFVVDVVSIG